VDTCTIIGHHWSETDCVTGRGWLLERTCSRCGTVEVNKTGSVPSGWAEVDIAQYHSLGVTHRSPWPRKYTEFPENTVFVISGWICVCAGLALFVFGVL
jgi:hypothetical protein